MRDDAARVSGRGRLRWRRMDREVAVRGRRDFIVSRWFEDDVVTDGEGERTCDGSKSPQVCMSLI